MDPVTGLSLGRIAVGVAALAAPSPTAKAFGIPPEANPQHGFITRMFGAREIALGAVTLAAKGQLRRRLTLVGIAVDGADAASGVAALRRKELATTAGGGLVAVALGAVGAGVLALRSGRD